MTITVYSKPNCVQCDYTKRELKKRNLSFSEIDLTKDQSSYDKVAELGYRSAPVVFAGDEHWSGFRPDKIAAL